MAQHVSLNRSLHRKQKEKQTYSDSYSLVSQYSVGLHLIEERFDRWAWVYLCITQKNVQHDKVWQQVERVDLYL